MADGGEKVAEKKIGKDEVTGLCSTTATENATIDAVPSRSPGEVLPRIGVPKDDCADTRQA